MNAKQKHYLEETRKVVESKGGIILSDIYISSQKPLRVRCGNGHEWDTTRDMIIHNRWCPKCNGNSNEGRREEVIKYIKEKGGQLVGEYVKSRSKITIRCSEGHEWTVAPYWLTDNNWCRKCTDREKKTRENFYQVVENKGGMVNGQYNGVRSILDFTCNQGHYWKAAVQDILREQWCANCSMGIDRSYQELLEIVKKKEGKIEGKYYNNKCRLTFTCKAGHQWSTKAFNIKCGTWCPHCRISKGEQELITIFNNLGIEHKTQFILHDLLNRRYDFMFTYNEDKYILEYDGQQHFDFVSFFHKEYDEFLRRQEIDRLKTYIALRSNYKVIRIDYTQRDNLEFHVRNAIMESLPIYVSTPEMYISWMSEAPISKEIIEKECPHILNTLL